jgi:hypothetical protein
MATSGKMLSPTKCIRCVLWEERHRQWLSEREQLLEEVKRLRATAGPTNAKKGQEHSVDVTTEKNRQTPPPLAPEVLGSESGSSGNLARRVSRTGSWRKLVVDAWTMTDEAELPLNGELDDDLPPTPVRQTDTSFRDPSSRRCSVQQDFASPSTQHHPTVNRSAIEALYEAEVRRSKQLEDERDKLNAILKRQSLELRDLLNANQRTFLLNHAAQVEEEKRFAEAKVAHELLNKTAAKINQLKAAAAATTSASSSGVATTAPVTGHSVGSTSSSTALSASALADAKNIAAVLALQTSRRAESKSVLNALTPRLSSKGGGGNSLVRQEGPTAEEDDWTQYKACKWCGIEVPPSQISTHPLRCSRRVK